MGIIDCEELAGVRNRMQPIEINPFFHLLSHNNRDFQVNKMQKELSLNRQKS